MTKNDLISELLKLGQESFLSTPTLSQMGQTVRILLQDASDACRDGDWRRAEDSCDACFFAQDLQPAYRGSIVVKIVKGIVAYYRALVQLGQDDWDGALNVMQQGADALAFNSPRLSATMWFARARIIREVTAADNQYALMRTGETTTKLFSTGLWCLQRSKNLIADLHDPDLQALSVRIDEEYRAFEPLWKSRSYTV